MKNIVLKCSAITILFGLFSSQVLAEEHVVKAMATKYEPVVVFAQPGDTVTWTNMAGHDSASLPGMIPEGAEAWQSKLGENFTVTLEKEGAYVYKCSPHVSLGMLGAIVVGATPPANLSAIDKALETTKEPKGMVKRVVKQLKQALAAK
ncbi:MAG: plastocyanin/azurin family copper-binding protein [Gammaproteobacteria bacterium]